MKEGNKPETHEECGSVRRDEEQSLNEKRRKGNGTTCSELLLDYYKLGFRNAVPQ